MKYNTRLAVKDNRITIDVLSKDKNKWYEIEIEQDNPLYQKFINMYKLCEE